MDCWGSRTILAVALGAAVFAAGATSASACVAPRPFDPYLSVKEHSRAEIVGLPEVIVEGAVTAPIIGSADNRPLGIATMRINKVWKGDVGPTVVLLYQNHSSDCSIPPPFDTPIRFGGLIVDKARLLGDGQLSSKYPELAPILAANRDVLVYPSYPEAMYLPLRDSELDMLLDSYSAETDSLKRKAENGNGQDLLVYVAHLQKNHEVHRALDVYEAGYRDHPHDPDFLLKLAIVQAQAHRNDEVEATLSELEDKAPKTDEWRGKIARTRFAAAGEFTPGWKDWSDLKLAAARCRSEDGEFDGASFDRSDLTGCRFRYGMFRHASFRHSDLSGAEIQYSVTTGAEYDCATKFPDDFDPVAAGMINVDGTCTKP